jgi:tol-pal system protein YbgF
MLLNLTLKRAFNLVNRNPLSDRRINPSRVKSMRFGLGCVSLLLSLHVYALAPVVDAYEDDDVASPTITENSPGASDNHSASRLSPNPAPAEIPPVSNNSASFSLEQRVTILERQMTNVNPLLVQIDDLQQQLRNLQGRFETQQHVIKVLEEQVRNQYLALDKRFAQRAHATYSSGKPLRVSNMTENTLAPRPLVDLSGSKKENSLDRKSMMPNAAPTPAAERAYQSAFQRLKSKQYNEAIDAFEAFTKKYPNDLNVANADYFLGQLYLLQGKAESSINCFTRFISRYSQDSRVPDAMLQCGLAYFAKGDKKMAMELFEKIIQQYPDSKAAQAAQARLQQFKAMISAASISSKNKV